MKLYQQLYREGKVDGFTIPDFPDLGKWGTKLAQRFGQLATHFRQWLRTQGELAKRAGRFEDPLKLTEIKDQKIPGYMATIAGQLRSEQEVKQRILAAVEQGAEILFFVSGSHPLRDILLTIPGLKEFVKMDAVKTLELATQLKEQGLIPPQVQFWASANPYVRKKLPAQLEYTRQKRDGGAKAVIVQPGLLEQEHEEWLQYLEDQGLDRDLQMINGVSLVHSAENLIYWFSLMGITYGGQEESKEMVEQWRQANHRLSQKDWAIEWNKRLANRAKGPNGTYGIHLMPMGAHKEYLEAVLNSEGFDLVSRLQADVEAHIQQLKKMGIAVVHEPGLKEERQVKNFRDCLEVLIQALKEIPQDQRPTFKIYWNKITYPHHFRTPIAFRPFFRRENDRLKEIGEWELAIDLHQFDSPSEFSQALRKTLTRIVQGKTLGKRVESSQGVAIGEYVPYSQSIVWEFNSAFWRHKPSFMKAHGRDYRDSIKGSPDTDPRLITYTAKQFFEQLKFSSGYYLEIGIASVDHAKLFMDELIEIARSQKSEYLLENFTYLLADSSRPIKEQAQAELGSSYRGIKLGYLLVDAEEPLSVLISYRGQILRIHQTNVMDNLPNDKFAQIDGKYYSISARLYLSNGSLQNLAKLYQLDQGEFTLDLQQLPMSGVDFFLEKYRSHPKFYYFWFDLWNEFKLEERYILEPDLENFNFVDLSSIPHASHIRPGQILQRVLQEYPRNVWMHLSNRAIESILKFLSLLDERGVLEIVDIIVKEISEYHYVKPRFSEKGTPLYPMGFKGPAKFEGTAVDWVNGRLPEAFAKEIFPDVEVTYTGLEELGVPKKGHMTIMELRRGLSKPLEHTHHPELFLNRQL